MSRDWDVTRKSIGSLSIWLGTAALFAPRALPRLLGVDESATRNDTALPLLVRLIAARNIAMGAALLVTPGFPEYTSGHSCATSAVMYAMRRFFGRDDLTFSASSADSGTTRTFHSFSQATAEVVEARIWGGVHFRSADVYGVEIGTGVARYVLAREFHPRH